MSYQYNEEGRMLNDIGRLVRETVRQEVHLNQLNMVGSLTSGNRVICGWKECFETFPTELDMNTHVQLRHMSFAVRVTYQSLKDALENKHGTMKGDHEQLLTQTVVVDSLDPSPSSSTLHESPDFLDPTKNNAQTSMHNLFSSQTRINDTARKRKFSHRRRTFGKCWLRTDDDKFVCKYENCGKMFGSMLSVNQHYKNEHLQGGHEDSEENSNNSKQKVNDNKQPQSNGYFPAIVNFPNFPRNL